MPMDCSRTHHAFARPDCRRYLSGIAVGAVVTAAGAQAAGTSLITLRAIVHALRPDARLVLARTAADESARADARVAREVLGDG